MAGGERLLYKALEGWAPSRPSFCSLPSRSLRHNHRLSADPGGPVIVKHSQFYAVSAGSGKGMVGSLSKINSAIAKIPLPISNRPVWIVGFVRGQDHAERSRSARRCHDKLGDWWNIRSGRFNRYRLGARLAQIVGHGQGRDIFPRHGISVRRILAARGRPIAEIPQIRSNRSIEIGASG